MCDLDWGVCVCQVDDYHACTVRVRWLVEAALLQHPVMVDLTTRAPLCHEGFACGMVCATVALFVLPTC